MQRKASKQSRGPNAAEKRFQAWLKEQSCCVYGTYGVEVHHCMGSAAKSNKVHIGHYFCLPLSKEKHDEYHSGTKAFKATHGPQWLLWSVVSARYFEETGELIPKEIHDAICDSGK